MRWRGPKLTLGVAAGALVLAGLGSASLTADAHAARIHSKQVRGITRFIYWAAPGELNRMSVTVSTPCSECESDKFVFRGTPRPTTRECRIAATTVTCETTSEQPLEGLRVYLGDRGDTATASGLPHTTLYGMAGNDRLKGQEVVGGLDNDIISGTLAADRLDGGPGSDHIYSAGGGIDTVICGPGIDFVRADRSDRLIGCERIVRV
jgi:hemolysin type calcium-binding protein